MIKEAAIRWAANAPSGALLAAAVRGELPIGPALQLQNADALDAGSSSPMAMRLWLSDEEPVLLKRYSDAEAYHRDVCSLRFFNAVARAHTPRLLACDDAAQALLIEDLPARLRAMTNRFVHQVTTGQNSRAEWSSVLPALAAVHSASEQQQLLLRRLFAPRRPAIAWLPSGGMLEQMSLRLTGDDPNILSHSDRSTLLAADSWLNAQLTHIGSGERLPMLGLATPIDIGFADSGVMFMRLDRSALGPQVADLAPTYWLRDRRKLIETYYVAERMQLGARVESIEFWESDAVLRVASLATILVDGDQAISSEAQTWFTLQVLVEAVLDIPNIEAAGRLLARLAPGSMG
ncbi:MAG: hypothetical protein JWO42_1111 [Chloroflexi bacterium]|nr:hypothetical protein [Chloroflexota bacterium]